MNAASLPLTTLSGVYFRQTDYDTPFWTRANSCAGRWNTALSRPTQYWAASPEVAWAERLRAEEISDEPAASQLRTPIWAARFAEAGILDLRDGVPRALRLTATELTGAHEPCRTVAEQLCGAGVRGIIAPSAAIDGHDALTLFGPRVDIDWREQPLLVGEVPTTIVAVGAPPPGLLARLRPPR
ncbi:MAG: RES family NAD+ phosphorylase [Patulibacter sp.]